MIIISILFCFFLEIFYRIAEKNPGPLISKMDKFIEACKKDSESIHTQISMFSILSTKLPKVDKIFIIYTMYIHYKVKPLGKF